MKTTKQVIATGIVAGIVGLVVGWGLSGSDAPSGHAPAAVAEQGETWTAQCTRRSASLDRVSVQSARWT